VWTGWNIGCGVWTGWDIGRGVWTGLNMRCLCVDWAERRVVVCGLDGTSGVVCGLD